MSCGDGCGRDARCRNRGLRTCQKQVRAENLERTNRPTVVLVLVIVCAESVTNKGATLMVEYRLAWGIDSLLKHVALLRKPLLNGQGLLEFVVLSKLPTLGHRC